jgi:uncharacterized protein YdiU (UPF0061 family)
MTIHETITVETNPVEAAREALAAAIKEQHKLQGVAAKYEEAITKSKRRETELRLGIEKFGRLDDQIADRAAALLLADKTDLLELPAHLVRKQSERAGLQDQLSVVVAGFKRLEEQAVEASKNAWAAKKHVDEMAGLVLAARADEIAAELRTHADRAFELYEELGCIVSSPNMMQPPAASQEARNVLINYGRLDPQPQVNSRENNERIKRRAAWQTSRIALCNNANAPLPDKETMI